MKTVSRGRIVAFALLLLVAIVAGFHTSGGKFANLGSSYLNNPNFVCTQASLMSGEVQYNQSTADIERLMVEKTALEKQVQSGKADISKQEAQVRRGEAQKKSADNTVKTLDNYIDKNCSASALKSLQNPRNNTRFTERQKICDQKKKELRDAKQDARKIQTQITQQKSALATLNSTITKAQADIISLGKKIKSAQDFVEDYETCKKSLGESSTTPIVTSMAASREISLSGIDNGGKSTFKIYNFSIKNASNKKMFTEKISFEIDGKRLDDWYIERIVNNEKGLVACLPHAKNNQLLLCDNHDQLEGGETKEYTLVAVHNTIDPSGSFKILFSGLNYNYGNERPESQGFSILGYNGFTVNLVPTATTQPALCGNGIKEGPEQCDDGNTNNGDSCDNQCKNTGPIISVEVACNSLGQNTGGCTKCYKETLYSCIDGAACNEQDKRLNYISGTVTNTSSLTKFIYSSPINKAGRVEFAPLQAQTDWSLSSNDIFQLPSTFNPLSTDINGTYLSLSGGSSVKWIESKPGSFIRLNSVAPGASRSKPAYRISLIATTHDLISAGNIGPAVDHKQCLFIYPRFCGDDILDTDKGEQCDDGNTNNDDSCDNNCKNTGPIISGEATPPTKLDKINRYGATVLAVLTKGIEYKNYTCTGRFSDIGKAYPACAFVESAAAAGLTNSANSTFRPRDNLTRYETLVFALRAADLIPSGFQTQSGLIQLGVDNGLITSVADFNVNTLATYGDFLHYLSEAMSGKTWNDFFSTETGITSIFN